MLDEIANGLYYWLHIGIPCTGWVSMNQVNGGSRTQANPEGIGFLERERRADLQALYVVEICLALHAVGAFFLN